MKPILNAKPRDAIYLEVFQHAGNVSKRHPGMQAADVPLRGWLSAARVPHVEPPNIKENAKLLRSKTI